MDDPATKKCPYCDHTWILRVKKPHRCPNCSHKLSYQESKDKGGK